MNRLWCGIVAAYLLSSVGAWALGAESPALVPQIGHWGSATSVAFSPDGKVLASGSDDGTIILWDATTGVQKQTLTGHTNAVNSVAFRPDGKVLASAGDATVILWDITTAVRLATLWGLDSGKSWLSATPEGYYAGSDNVSHYIHWRVGDALFPAEQFAEEYHRPDLVAKALAGKP